MILFDGIEQLQSVEAAALQPDVEEDKARLLGDDRRQRVIAVARRARFIALVLQDTGYQIADIGFVVDYQNVCENVATRSRLAFSVRSFRRGLRARPPPP